MPVCRICDNSKNNFKFVARDMMYGGEDEFKYFECSRCGCLQMLSIPEDMSPYYPENYYSYIKRDRKQNRIKVLLNRYEVRYSLTRKGVLGKLLHAYKSFPHFYDGFCKRGLTFKSKIIDLGCGDGYRLFEMNQWGFEELTGADPFIDNDINYGTSVKVHKKFIHEIRGKYDLVMMHHSFEHIPNPIETLESISGLLRSDGWCLISMPLADSYAWRKYNTNWVQLDAPRHLFLHTKKSMLHLANKFKFKIDGIDYNSSEFQFWGSEQYATGILLSDKKSYAVNPRESIFIKKQIKEYRKQAIELNSAKEGDSALFWLRLK